VESFFASINPDTREHVNGDLLFLHYIISLQLCKEYVTAVKFEDLMTMMMMMMTTTTTLTPNKILNVVI